MTINAELLYYYKQARSASGPSGHEYPWANNEPFFRNATEAYHSARRHIHFRKTLKADIKAYKKRSQSAKRGWKTHQASL